MGKAPEEPARIYKGVYLVRMLLTIDDAHQSKFLLFGYTGCQPLLP